MGDKCDFLHKYEEDKMPICKFVLQNGICHKQENCAYRHPKPEDEKRREPCPYYYRGFCKLGSACVNYTHDIQKLCSSYMLGFCPDGPNCSFAHVKFSIAHQDLKLSILANFPPEEEWSDRKALTVQEFIPRQPE